MIVARLPPLGDNATFKLTARSLFDKGGFCDGDLGVGAAEWRLRRWRLALSRGFCPFRVA